MREEQEKRKQPKKSVSEAKVNNNKGGTRQGKKRNKRKENNIMYRCSVMEGRDTDSNGVKYEIEEERKRRGSSFVAYQSGNTDEYRKRKESIKEKKKDNRKTCVL